MLRTVLQQQRTARRERQAAAADPAPDAPPVRPPLRAARPPTSCSSALRIWSRPSPRTRPAQDAAEPADDRQAQAPRRSPRPQSRRAAGASAALRGGDRRRARGVPLLRRRHALHRRTAHRAARHRARATAGAGHPPPALRLPRLRGRRGGGAGAGAADRWRHADRGADRARGGQQVLRLPAAVSAVADAGAPGHHAGPLDAEQLGGQRLLVADAALRPGGRHGAVVDQGVRRRHHAAGARSRPRPDQDRTAVVLRGR